MLLRPSIFQICFLWATKSFEKAQGFKKLGWVYFQILIFCLTLKKAEIALITCEIGSKKIVYSWASLGSCQWGFVLNTLLYFNACLNKGIFLRSASIIKMNRNFNSAGITAGSAFKGLRPAKTDKAKNSLFSKIFLIFINYYIAI